MSNGQIPTIELSNKEIDLFERLLKMARRDGMGQWMEKYLDAMVTQWPDATAFAPGSLPEEEMLNLIEEMRFYIGDPRLRESHDQILDRFLARMRSAMFDKDTGDFENMFEEEKKKAGGFSSDDLF